MRSTGLGGRECWCHFSIVLDSTAVSQTIITRVLNMPFRYEDKC
jgi:hypothetical protein